MTVPKGNRKEARRSTRFAHFRDRPMNSSRNLTFVEDSAARKTVMTSDLQVQARNDRLPVGANAQQETRWSMDGYTQIVDQVKSVRNDSTKEPVLTKCWHMRQLILDSLTSRMNLVEKAFPILN